MKKLELTVSFADTNKDITFNLHKNTIFHGLNGRGKTRILNTIQFLHDLCSEEDYERIYNYIEISNLTRLLINNTNYRDIFLEKDRFNEKEQTKLEWFIQLERDVLEEIVFLLEKVLTEMRFLLSTSDQRQFSNYINQGKYFLSYIHKDFQKENVPPRYRTFSSWLEVMRRRILSMFKQTQGLYDNNYDELVNNPIYRLNKLIKELILSYQNFRTSRRHSQEEDLLSWKKIRENIVNQLKDLTIVSIPADRKHGQSIVDFLQSEIENINEAIIANYWMNSDKKNNSKKIIDDFYKKLDKLNNVLNNYCRLEIILEDKLIQIVKNGELLNWEGLSSGESNLLHIFATIIFTDSKIILLDEPELSFSLNYQSFFVRDLMRVKENRVIILASHAPFIFEDFLAYEDNVEIEV